MSMKGGISKGKLKLKGRAADPMASARSTTKQRGTLPGTVLEAIKPANVRKVLRWGSGTCPSLMWWADHLFLNGLVRHHAGVGRRCPFENWKPILLRLVFRASTINFPSFSDHAAHLQNAVAVDSDGSHDEDLAEYMHDCTDITTLSINVVLDLGFPVDWCHESLQLVAETWAKINSIPFRSCPYQSILHSGESGEGWERTMMLNTSDKNETDFCVDSVCDLLQLAWPLLLASSADPERNIADAALQRMMKDAFDNGVKRPLSRPRATSTRADLDYLPDAGDLRRASLDRGRVRLSSLYKSQAWRQLPSTVKEHKMHACDMERSFDDAPRKPLSETSRTNNLADISAGLL